MKRILSNLNSIASVLLAGVLVLMVGFIGLRNPLRVNLSDRTYYELSEKTLSLLNELENEVVITVFFQEEHKLYLDIENLLEEYEYLSRNIRVEWVDPTRDLARMEKLVSKYGLTEAQVVVFDIDGKFEVKKQSDIATLKLEKGHREPTIIAFRGEQAFSSAIYGLMQGETPTVYFLVGHGERRVTDFDQMAGFSKIGTKVLQDNLDVQELVLTAKKKIPDDAGEGLPSESVVLTRTVTWSRGP